MRLIFVMMLVVLVGGCSEYNSDMRVVWSTSVQNLDDPYGDAWQEREIDEHEKCRHKHHVDPYTKLEYCLPDDLASIQNMHNFRVKKRSQ